MTAADSTYTARPGGVPDRVLAAMRALTPYGAEISTSALAERAGVPASAINSSMFAAMRAGAIFGRKKGGHERSPMFWSLHDHSTGTPPPKRAKGADATDEDDEPLHGSPGANGKLPASSIFDLAERQAKIAQARAPQAAGPATPLVIAPPKLIADDFRVGLFSDGQLRIEWRGQIIELEREQTEQLVRFLDRLAPEVETE